MDVLVLMMIKLRPARTGVCMAAMLTAALLLAAMPHARAAESTKANDTARFLAGLPPVADATLIALTREASWQAHARSFDAAWSSLEKRQLSKIRAWSAANITAPAPVAFYMFSGPDYLYVDAFLPNRSTYVLAGLEPVGQIPLITEASRRTLAHGLGGLRGSLGTVLNYSFFITKKMRTNLTATTFRGTLPILYIFLARAGKTVHEVNLIAVNDDGAVVPASEADAQAKAPGVKIVFSSGEGPKQTLYYFRTDVSDPGLKSSGFLKFCEQLGKGDSFLKSASYLPHAASFSRIRDFLLEHSQALVQDDSGVPLRYFKPEEWNLRPFGRYLGPIGEFPGRYQKGLNDLFQRAKAPRIDFGLGYRWRPNESNLLLAEKKAR